MIKARNVDPSSALRYINLTWEGALPALTGALNGILIGVYLFKQTLAAGVGARVVDIVVAQALAGTAGTSWSAAVKKNGTAIYSTAPVLALASGAYAAVDSKAELALPTGATRGVLKTDSTILIKKGDVLSWDLTVTGTYTGAAPYCSVSLVIDPYPV